MEEDIPVAEGADFDIVSSVEELVVQRSTRCHASSGTCHVAHYDTVRCLGVRMFPT